MGRFRVLHVLAAIFSLLLLSTLFSSVPFLAFDTPGQAGKMVNSLTSRNPSSLGQSALDQSSSIQSVFATFQENISGTPVSPNLIVDNTLYITPVRLQWVNGTRHSIQFLPFFASSDQSIRYNFSAGTVTNRTKSYNMTGSQMTVTPISNLTFSAGYSSQFRLLISGPQGNSSLYYNPGSKVTFSVPNFTLSSTPAGSSAYYYVAKQGQIRYRFISVTGAGTGSNSSQTPVGIKVVMVGPITETVNAQIEFGLTVIGTPLSITNTTWYNKSQIAIFKPILFSQNSNGTMYNVTGWISTPPPSSMNSSAWTFVMNQTIAVAANFSTFYYLSVQTAYGQPRGSGWYRPNSTATFSITPSMVGTFPFDLIFAGWSGDFIGGSQSGSIKMTHPSTVVANWALDARGPLIITAIPVVAALAYITWTYVLKKGNRSKTITNFKNLKSQVCRFYKRNFETPRKRLRLG